MKRQLLEKESKYEPLKKKAKHQTLEAKRDVHLNQHQKLLAKLLVEIYFANGPDKLGIFDIRKTFYKPSLIQKMLHVCNYDVFHQALENKDLELIKYLLYNNTPRGEFLAMCHNNYEAIDKFIKKVIADLKSNTYDKNFTAEVLSLFIEIRPKIMKVIIKERIDNILKDAPEIYETLNKSFEKAITSFQSIKNNTIRVMQCFDDSQYEKGCDKINKYFPTPILVQKMMNISEHKLLYLAMENRDITLVKSLLRYNTEAGNIRAIRHNKCSVIEKFIEHTNLDIKAGTYQQDNAVEVLKLFIKVKPVAICEILEKNIKHQQEISPKVFNALDKALTTAKGLIRI